MFSHLVEEVRIVVEGGGDRQKRREAKLAKRYAGLIKTTGSKYGAGAEKVYGQAIARDIAVSKKSGRQPLKGGEAAWLRKHRDKQG